MPAAHSWPPQLWNEAGTMLATSHQIVYYKE